MNGARKAWLASNEKPHKYPPLVGEIMPYITKWGIPAAYFDLKIAESISDGSTEAVPGGMLVAGDYDELYIAIERGTVVPYPGKLVISPGIVAEREKINEEENEKERKKYEPQDRQPA